MTVAEQSPLRALDREAGLDAPCPKVTAVVLNWCNEEVTRACLASLAASDYRPLAVLLVDNGSPDGSGERLREAFPEVDFLQTGANLGYAGGNNRGIVRAMEEGADFVLVVNNDIVLAPDAVSHLVRTALGGAEEVRRSLCGRLRRRGAKNGPVGGVSPKILYHHDPARIWFGGGCFSPLRGLGLHLREGERDDRLEEGPGEISFMTGACCLLSARALQEVGGFDENFFAYVEDADLSLRLLRAGYRLLYQPRARVLHHAPPPGTPPTPFQIRQRDRNRLLVMAKHYSPWQRFPFLARFLATRIALGVGYVLRGDRERVRALWEGWRSGWR